jgi:hypothetical protein
MGRMKDLYMEIVYANDGVIPHQLKTSDLKKMKDLEIFEWEMYERAQKKKNSLSNEEDN